MTNRPTKRRSMNLQDRKAFIVKHGSTCAICSEEDLATPADIRDRLFAEGVYKVTIVNGEEFWPGNYTSHPDMKLKSAHIDHIYPLNRGGSNEESNLQLLCALCNNSKGSLTMEEFYTRERYRKGLDELSEAVADILGVDPDEIHALSKGHNALTTYPILEKILALGGDVE